MPSPWKICRETSVEAGILYIDIQGMEYRVRHANVCMWFECWDIMVWTMGDLKTVAPPADSVDGKPEGRLECLRKYTWLQSRVCYSFIWRCLLCSPGRFHWNVLLTPCKAVWRLNFVLHGSSQAFSKDRMCSMHNCGKDGGPFTLQRW